MTPEELKLKHLELIQGVINRLAGNSFSMKGWSITLIAALMALAANNANERYAAIALLPALCFWGLDSYYLRQERLFRKLYDAVRSDSVPSLSMSTEPVARLVDNWLATTISVSVFWLHFPILIAVVIVTIYALNY